MALDSTPRRRFGVALGVVLTGVAAGLIGFAGSASAHTPHIKAECVDGVGPTTLSVKLTQYNDQKPNSVKVTDGDTVLDETDFGTGYEKKWDVAADVAHTFTVEVKAWDDPNGKNKWSFTEVKEVAKCVTETTTTTTTTESETTQPPTETTTTTTTESETPTSSSPVPTTTVAPTTTTAEVEEAALAETGASIGLPLGIAGVLLVGGGIALFIVRRRGKA